MVWVWLSPVTILAGWPRTLRGLWSPRNPRAPGEDATTPDPHRCSLDRRSQSGRASSEFQARWRRIQIQTAMCGLHHGGRQHCEALREAINAAEALAKGLHGLAAASYEHMTAATLNVSLHAVLKEGVHLAMAVANSSRLSRSTSRSLCIHRVGSLGWHRGGSARRGPTSGKVRHIASSISAESLQMGAR